MKAIVYRRHGPPDMLRCEELEVPSPREGEVLLQVRAAALNPLDWKLMSGGTGVVRWALGLGGPRLRRVGVDVAGRVEAVGGGVTRFRAGDAVFGSCRGALAEYANAPVAALAAKPKRLTFAQAAAVPVAGYTALQGLRDRGRLQAGGRVLVNGASGGVGTFAVQIAHAFGARVTGVCSAGNAELVRGLGAEEVVDYAREDFTRAGRRYDLILDCIGNHPPTALRRALAPRGVCVMAGAPDDAGLLLARLLGALVLSRFVRQDFIPFVARRRQADLMTLSELIAAGKVTPVIDRTYPLSEAGEAVRYASRGHARGKVIVVPGDDGV